MKNSKFTLSCFVALSVLAAASCKKKEDDSVKARLTGKWKANQYAVDINNNNVMDADEIDSFNSSYITFAGDGTGHSESDMSTDNSTFTWTLKNNDADVVTKETSGSSTGSQSTLHIESLSSSDLKISQVDSATSIKVWMMLKKQ